MGKTERSVYVAYIGTTKVAFLKADVKTDDRFEVSALSARLAFGFDRGMVKDLTHASHTLSEVVHDVIGHEGHSVLPCRLVVSNACLKNYTFQSSVYFQSHPHSITLKDVRQAIAQTRSVATIPLQEVIVQAVPQGFLVNDLVGVQNPLGLEATRLGVTLHLLALDFLVYSNLLKVFERCDLEVTEIIPSVISAAHRILDPQEKHAGVILAMIGGQVSHFACYKNGILVETRSIPIGADCITEAIAKNLNVDHLNAQRLKETFGSASPKFEFQDELIPVPDTNGHKRYPIKRSEFEAQMNSGLNTFFTEIRREIVALQERYSPTTHVVFTGGGSRLEGFLDVVRESISPTARIGVVQELSGPEALLNDPTYSGILGGLDFTSKLSEDRFAYSDRPGWVSRAIARARNWIFEYL
ncbi:MAG: cell division protein FtsA [Candidatus Omnitrophica bacterium]|nr:cell division protein FtsA [Candidatus Omnitrophota bacterium]